MVIKGREAKLAKVSHQRTETAATAKDGRAKERGENSPTVDERKLYAESVSPVETGFL